MHVACTHAQYRRGSRVVSSRHPWKPEVWPWGHKLQFSPKYSTLSPLLCDTTVTKAVSWEYFRFELPKPLRTATVNEHTRYTHAHCHFWGKSKFAMFNLPFPRSCPSFILLGRITYFFMTDLKASSSTHKLSTSFLRDNFRPSRAITTSSWAAVSESWKTVTSSRRSISAAEVLSSLSFLCFCLCLCTLLLITIITIITTTNTTAPTRPADTACLLFDGPSPFCSSEGGTTSVVDMVVDIVSLSIVIPISDQNRRVMLNAILCKRSERKIGSF